MAALRDSTAGFPEEIANAITSDNELSDQIVSLLLQEHFPATIHDDLLSAFGLPLDSSTTVSESAEAFTIAPAELSLIHI